MLKENCVIRVMKYNEENIFNSATEHKLQEMQHFLIFLKFIFSY